MKRAAALAHIRQICCLGMGGQAVMPALLKALRGIIACDSAGFFWVDASGNMVNLYAERMLEPHAMAAFFERYHDSGPFAFKPGFQRRAHAADSVSVSSLSTELERSAYYNDILKSLDAYHVLYGIVREQGAALGQVSLYRSKRSAPFGAPERRTLTSVMRYVAHALNRAPLQAGEAFVDSDDEGVVIVDKHGNVQQAAGNSRRLLLLATHQRFSKDNHASLDSPRVTETLSQLTGRLLAVFRGGDGSPPRTFIDNAWGRFGLRAFWLSDDPHAPDALIAVQIQRMQPLVLKLADAMQTLGLSPQQREVALQLAQGRTNQQIAEAMNVSANTAAYHIKQLFAKLDAHDRQAAVDSILRSAR